MRIIKNRQLVEDSFEVLPVAAPVPEKGHVLVPLETWNAQRATLTERAASGSGQVGVWLDSHEQPDAIEGLEMLSHIAVNFPKFADGRGYTIARRLRQRLGYPGELRAIGDVLRDQLFYMQRCGFDAFALLAGKNAEESLSAFDDFSISYQGAADDPRPLYRRVER